MKHLNPAVLLLALFASCATEPVCEQPGPADHLVIFGSLRIDSLLVDQPIEGMVIDQIEPGFPAVVTQPCVEGTMFFTEPLPFGGRWRLASFVVAGEELPVSVELSPEAPGLFFVGSLEVIGDPHDGFSVRRRDFPDERAHLQTLLDAYSGTPWDGPVRERIRSLDHE